MLFDHKAVNNDHKPAVIQNEAISHVSTCMCVGVHTDNPLSWSV